MFKEYYNEISTYLIATFDADFILLTVLITTGISIVYFIGMSYIITQMDTRYFIRKNAVNKTNSAKKYDDKFNKNHNLTLLKSSVTVVIQIVKIIIGVFLLLCGLLMLVLPGQGLITMVIGLSLIPFPGKDKLVQYILSRKSIRTSLNWIRVKAKKEPFIFD
ncbi:hypothetical protein [Colwellia echini]|uniref:Transmembrane protein (PGPGW) n=1 Tax=Colwellia echini TaxID=1982103 RepID=A0ABY3MYJ6_9GAMM|nr:hypothetical protein [Colwellia echini]TYK66280.1 hypothetical protein CWS31_006715 [Colwellia echini]